MNPCLVASDTIVRRILIERRGTLGWSSGLSGVGLELGARDGWDHDQAQRERGRHTRQGHNLRQTCRVRAVVLAMRAVISWLHRCVGGIQNMLEG